MSSLSQIEMQKCEAALLAMGGGYVLNFSSQNFDRFVKGTVGADIFSARREIRDLKGKTPSRILGNGERSGGWETD
jgi:hypothetical protein